MCSQFVERRGNFHGIQLKAMVCREQFLLDYPENVEAYATYFPNNETYMINGFTYGIFDDVFKIMEYTLNFSSAKYKRKVEAWGSIYPQPDGSFKGTGIGMLF